jgi:hypothetical protein
MSELDFGQALKSTAGFEPFGYQYRLASGDNVSNFEGRSARSSTVCPNKIRRLDRGNHRSRD